MNFIDIISKIKSEDLVQQIGSISVTILTIITLYYNRTSRHQQSILNTRIFKNIKRFNR